MFIELEVKLGIIVHGYSAENKEIEEIFQEPEFVKKIFAIDGINLLAKNTSWSNPPLIG